MSKLTCSSRPLKIPPAAAKQPPNIQTSRMTFSESIPVAEARSGLSDTARVAFPRRVNRKPSAVTIKMTKHRTETMKSRGVILIGPRSQAFCNEKSAKGRVRPSNLERKKFRSAIDKPTVKTIWVTRPTPRRRRGPKMPLLSAQPKPPPRMMPNGAAQNMWKVPSS